MNDFSLISSNSELSEEDKNTVREGMLRYHAGKGHTRNEKDDYFSIVVKNAQSRTVGAIIVSFRWGAMHVETLWIEESSRKKGLGTKLMDEVEKEAVRRGCHLAYTDTFSWQAPKFYEKLGYRLYGKLDDYPKNNCLSYYFKKLAD
jgi:ribosomal protein S18 acetylase RimI-like enzyme